MDDEGIIWEISLQDLKGSTGSDVESNMINLEENNDVHANADMLQRAREVRKQTNGHHFDRLCVTQDHVGVIWAQIRDALIRQWACF